MTCCRRNALVALDLIVTVIAGGLTLVAAVAGICGMNLAPLPIQDNNVSLSAFNCKHFQYSVAPAILTEPTIIKHLAHAQYSQLKERFF